MCCLSGFGNSASRVASRRGVLHGFCHAWNFQCRSLALDFPPPSVPPSGRPRPRRGHVVEATATVGLSRTPGSGVQQRGRAESREREAVIRVAAKSKFKSNPYLHLSPCRRQIPPCFHIQVRCFNPETDAHCRRVSSS